MGILYYYYRYYGNIADAGGLYTRDNNLFISQQVMSTASAHWKTYVEERQCPPLEHFS